MAEVPRIVRERLGSQATPGEHPDANLLSAFAEQALTGQERANVLDHLSRCAECREVVALLEPAEVGEEGLVTAVAPAVAGTRRSWWRSPVVHWSALTAAALVVLIAVGAHMRLREGRSASAPAIAKGELEEKPAIPPPEPAQGTAGKVAETAPRPRRAATSNAPKVLGSVGGAKVATRNNVPATVAANKAAAAPAPPAAVIEKSLQQTADQFGVSVTEGRPLEKQRKIDQAEVKVVPVPSASAPASAGAAAAPALKGESAMLYQGRDAILARRASLSARWSISDSGALQRSFDGGRSWKEVAVAEGVIFRAVATVGRDVWAGGSGGALFHSADGGELWSRVRVQADGRVLGGEIVRIEFADARNGVLATSTGESWTTTDGGATWRPQ